jgi:protein ImuB
MLFACLYVPRRPDADPVDASVVLAVAHDFSPRVEVHAPSIVSLDVSGLGSLLGPARTIGGELRKSAADRGLYAHVALSASRAVAVVMAAARAGLTVVEPGGERDALAPLPLRALEAGALFVEPGARAGEPVEPRADRSVRASARDTALGGRLQPFETFRRWGLRTIGDVALLPPEQVFERMGALGLAWHRLASGSDPVPLVPVVPEERFEETLELEWPIEGLEPLSFVLGRLFDPLCARLEDRDRGVAALHVRLRLVTREVHARTLQLPAPIRDARALRTLALLDLESHPPPAAIDAVTVAADPTPGRILQYSLLTRALPAAERVSTLLARLIALAGDGRIGSPRLVDTYRPGAFDMTPFTAFATDAAKGRNARMATPEGGSPAGPQSPAPSPDARRASAKPEPRSPSPDAHFAKPEVRTPTPDPLTPPDTVGAVLRRFRSPIPARVAVEGDRPVRVTTDRRGFGGGRVEVCAGPWRSSGEWWHHGAIPSPEARGPGPEAGGVSAGGFDRRSSSAPPREWVSTHRSGYGVRGAILPDPASAAHDRDAQAEYIYALNFLVRESPADLMRGRTDADGPLFPAARAGAPPWTIDEWDVSLADGAVYRLCRDRETGRWYISGIVD